ncbi:phage holin family protein [Candidatus Uhrbacteria bacterium]|nr:phage holin family protein [Candidatus Uhrbacteria bacterium]
MMLILRWVISAVLLLLAASFVPGFEVNGLYAALIAALVLGLINAIIRPLLFLLTLPVTILTLGLFTFVLNGLMVLLMSTVVKGVELDGLVPAILVGLVMWIGGWAANTLIREASES